MADSRSPELKEAQRKLKALLDEKWGAKSCDCAYNGRLCESSFRAGVQWAKDHTHVEAYADATVPDPDMTKIQL